MQKNVMFPCPGIPDDPCGLIIALMPGHRERCPSCSIKWNTYRSKIRRQRIASGEFDSCEAGGFRRTNGNTKVGRTKRTGRYCRYCRDEIIDKFDRHGKPIGEQFWRVCTKEKCRRRRTADSEGCAEEFHEFAPELACDLLPGVMFPGTRPAEFRRRRAHA